MADALAAAGAGAGAELGFFKLRAGGGVLAQIAIGNAVAQADDHGRRGSYRANPMGLDC
ncbi:MAG TPA: hypothetical protein VNV16_07400 [Methylibium sp.]|nr:hypothetical protein [Methylibium sp.]